MCRPPRHTASCLLHIFARLGIDLSPMPPARSVKAIDPAVLRVTVDFEKVDFVRIEHQQAEMRRRCFRVGMNDSETGHCRHEAHRVWAR